MRQLEARHTHHPCSEHTRMLCVESAMQPVFMSLNHCQCTAEKKRYHEHDWHDHPISVTWCNSILFSFLARISCHIRLQIVRLMLSLHTANIVMTRMPLSGIYSPHRLYFLFLLLLSFNTQLVDVSLTIAPLIQLPFCLSSSQQSLMSHVEIPIPSTHAHTQSSSCPLLPSHWLAHFCFH